MEAILMTRFCLLWRFCCDRLAEFRAAQNRARLAPVCFDSKHPSQRQECTDKPIVTSKMEALRVAVGIRPANVDPRYA